MDLNFKKKTNFVLLGLISFKPMSGFELKKYITDNLDFFWQESYGQIYPSLKYLYDNDYLTCRGEITENTPDKKVYSITNKGLNILSEWVKLPCIEIPKPRNELLLKLYLGNNIPVQLSIDQLQIYIKKLEIEKVKLEAKNTDLQKRQITNKSFIFQRISTLNGIMRYDAEIKWAILSVSLLKNISIDFSRSNNEPRMSERKFPLNNFSSPK